MKNRFDAPFVKVWPRTREECINASRAGRSVECAKCNNKKACDSLQAMLKKGEQNV